MNWKLVILNLVPLIILIPSIVLRFSSVEPFHRGYFCLDTSIQYPYVEHQTIPSYLCLLIWIILGVFHFTMSFITHRSWKMLMQGVYKFLLGFSLCLLVTDVSKFSLGRLRPYFMAVCNPNLNFVCYDHQIEEPEYDENGTYFYPEIHHQRYVDEVDTCTTLDRNVLKEARLSFVSGHASTSFYAAVFLTIFMNSYITEWSVRILLQITHILLAIWISITRITDYMHHPEDVVFGCILGIFTALLVHRYSKKDENKVDEYEMKTVNEEDNVNARMTCSPDN
jgi:phosphatidate phosphatase